MHYTTQYDEISQIIRLEDGAINDKNLVCGSLSHDSQGKLKL